MEVGAWFYDNIDDISGISFLPFNDHVYQQAPYQDCDAETYKEWVSKMPKDVDWSELATYEAKDFTAGSQDLAGSAGGCEVVDL